MAHDGRCVGGPIGEAEIQAGGGVVGAPCRECRGVVECQHLAADTGRGRRAVVDVEQMAPLVHAAEVQHPDRQRQGVGVAAAQAHLGGQGCEIARRGRRSGAGRDRERATCAGGQRGAVGGEAGTGRQRGRGGGQEVQRVLPAHVGDDEVARLTRDGQGQGVGAGCQRRRRSRGSGG